MILPSAGAARRLVVIFWVLAAAAIPLWAHFNVPGWGWDFHVYADTVECLREGRDPYLEGTMAQEDFYPHRPYRGRYFLPRPGHPPLPYLYPPLTLPVLRAVGMLPPAGIVLVGWLYWVAYVAGVLAVLWAVMQFVEVEERNAFALIAPAAVFFPGLVQHDAVLGGNVAYILYGLVLAAAAQGWRSRLWGWFYAAVFFASCLKIPMLSLLAIPLLSARRQWVPVSATALAGLGTFAVQAFVWPSDFHRYVTAANLDLESMGFGLSPAGLLGRWLYEGGRSYRMESALFYLLYAVPVAMFLIYLSRGLVTGWSQWGPVMLVGVFSLNPRLKEYDVAPLTIPLALVAFRFLSATTKCRRRAYVWLALTLTGASLFAAFEPAGKNSWNWTACTSLAVIFFISVLHFTRCGLMPKADIKAEETSSAGIVWAGQ